jgi:hypothetical protein
MFLICGWQNPWIQRTKYCPRSKIETLHMNMRVFDKVYKKQGELQG